MQKIHNKYLIISKKDKKYEFSHKLIIDITTQL